MSRYNLEKLTLVGIPLERIFPFLRWWPMVNRRTTRADIIAGVTGAVIVLPQGVAFAIIAGLPPEYGLYSAIVPAVIAAFFGSSFHLISGPTTAISIVILTTVGRLAVPSSPEYIQMVLTLTFLVGLFQAGLGFGKAGITRKLCFAFRYCWVHVRSCYRHCHKSNAASQQGSNSRRDTILCTYGLN